MATLMPTLIAALMPTLIAILDRHLKWYSQQGILLPSLSTTCPGLLSNLVICTYYKQLPSL